MLQKNVLITKSIGIVSIIFWDLLSDNTTLNAYVNINLIWEKYWQVIKIMIKVMINKQKSSPTNNSFVCNANAIEDWEEISEKFNNFFVNVGPSIAKSIPASGKDPVDYMTKHVGDTFKMSPVTENEVVKIIENFKDSAAGWDDLRPNVMKRIKDCIKIPLTR